MFFGQLSNNTCQWHFLRKLLANELAAFCQLHSMLIFLWLIGGDEAFHGSVDSSGIFTSSSAISSCTANDIHPAFIQSSISVSGGQNVFTELGDVGSHGKQHHHDYSNLARHGQRRIFGSFNSLSTEICKGVCESVSCHTVDYDHHKDVLQTVQGVSVKELVKVIGEF